MDTVSGVGFASVTVIMPVRNEEKSIADSLNSVLDQDYPPEKMQILVVDGMSQDRTRDIVRSLSADWPHRELEIVDNPGEIVATGFNRGLSLARGEVIVRVDGHCELQRDYVRRCVQLLSEKSADNVGGMQSAYGVTKTGEAISLAATSRFGVGNAHFRYATQPGWVDTVYLGAWRKEVFDRIGGFDEDLVRNQDDEFNFRLTQSGGRIWFDPALQTRYRSRSGLKQLWRQYFEYGFYKVLVGKKRGGVASWRQIVPSAFVVGILVGIVLAIATTNILWAIVLPLAYLVIGFASSVLAVPNQPALWPALLSSFAIMHVAYGLGFLWGIVRWLP